MKSYIIELRELDNVNALNINGNYDIQMKYKNVILNDQDSVSIKSLFLDTTAQNSGKIKIDGTNQDISITNYLYMTNFRLSGEGGRTLSYDDSLPKSKR